LQKGLKIEPTSEYAHDRLASALKGGAEEQKKFDKIIKEGKGLLRSIFFETEG
jgi:hypothetical protein